MVTFKFIDSVDLELYAEMSRLSCVYNVHNRDIFCYGACLYLNIFIIMNNCYIFWIPLEILLTVISVVFESSYIHCFL